MSLPSIFNDVIGPVMRGPSSSHSAAACRMGLFARALMGDTISQIIVKADTSGSLPTTYHSQGSEMGLLGGLLGFDISDERLKSYKKEIKLSGIKTDFVVGEYGDPHPNTYRISLHNDTESHDLVAISPGGGMIEIIEIDGVQLSLQGESYVAIIYYGDKKDAVEKVLETYKDNFVIEDKESSTQPFFLIETSNKITSSTFSKLEDVLPATDIRICPPVLPVITPSTIKIPFSNSNEMLLYNKGANLNLAQLAIEYESSRGALHPDEVISKMVEIVQVVRKSIAEGLAGTEYEDRILGHQSGRFKTAMTNGELTDLGVLNTVIAYTTALMEVKSSMGVIVAAPTAGSCGGVPATIFGVAESLDCTDKQFAEAFLIAGLIGVFIAKDATFSAEVGGCQAECGAGSGMAAAAVAHLQGGSVEQCLTAASMALQNSLGMVCDPVANRVEVPCLGKNVLSASNALAAANMGLAGFDPVITLYEVILTMDKVGKSIPHELRCTGLGGLSLTPSSKKIMSELQK